MQPVFFFLSIMACGDDGSGQCTAARVEPARYATVAECRAQLPAALARNTDLSAPVIAADCRASGPLTIARAGKTPPRG
jgi:hypothetical protein